MYLLFGTCMIVFLYICFDEMISTVDYGNSIMCLYLYLCDEINLKTFVPLVSVHACVQTCVCISMFPIEFYTEFNNRFNRLYLICIEKNSSSFQHPVYSRILSFFSSVPLLPPIPSRPRSYNGISMMAYTYFFRLNSCSWFWVYFFPNFWFGMKKKHEKNLSTWCHCFFLIQILLWFILCISS